MEKKESKKEEEELTPKEQEEFEEISEEFGNFPKVYRKIEEVQFYDTFQEKMFKTHKLLKFYKKNDTIIKFRLSDRPNISFLGKITNLSFVNDTFPFMKRANATIELENEKGIKTTTFLEDIDYLTILPKDIKETPIYFQQPKRISLPSKLRFNIFKRDNNTCQYCGRSPPEVELEVDHINPVSKGGTDELNNLITSCVDCNRGKGNNLLEE